MLDKGKHGGARSGAGRPVSTNSKAQSIRLSKEVWDLRDKIAAKTGENKRQVMERAVREMADREFN